MSDGYFLLVGDDHYVPVKEIVGIFNLKVKTVKELYNTLNKKGKLLLLTIGADDRKSLILLKNGLGVVSPIPPKELNERFTADPYPKILKTMLVELFKQSKAK